MTDTITVTPNTFAIAKGLDAARRQGIEEAVKALPEFGSGEEVMYFRGPWQAGYDSAIELSRQAIRKLLDKQPVNLADGLSTSQFVIVPVEPTAAMIWAGANCAFECPTDNDRKMCADIWRAMIEARAEAEGW